MWNPRPRQPLVGLALGAVLGILGADYWHIPPIGSGSILLCGLLGLLFRPSTAGCSIFCAGVFFFLHSLAIQQVPGRTLAQALVDHPRVIQAKGIVWNEPQTPTFWSRHITARFRLRLESIRLGDHTSSSSGFINVAWAGPVPAYGDRVIITGSASNLQPARNPGQFNAQAYANRQGVWSEVQSSFATDCQIISHNNGNPAQALAYRTAHWIQAQLGLGLEDQPEISGLITSMILGLRGESPPEMKALFQRTGTMHLFAVSGLNVAMLAAITLFLLRRLRIGRVPSILITLSVLASYALVTGLTSSCLRATVMCSLVLVAYLVDRRPLVFNSLGAAALAILAWDTNQLFSPGFQFSFVLVITIVWLSGKISRRLAPIGQPDPFLPRSLWSWRERAGSILSESLANTLGVTLSAWAGSFLFTIGYFHLFSPSALLANLLAVPLAFAVLVLGIASLLTAPLWNFGAVLCNNANWLCAKMLLLVLQICSLIPGGWIYLETPSLQPSPICEFTVFDLAQGGATHLRSEDSDWLFDCGSLQAYQHVVLPYLRTRGVNQLDGFLITHGDAKHLGGALELLSDFQPKSIVDSVLRDRSTTRREIHATLAKIPQGKGLYCRGDSIFISPQSTLRVLYPPAGIQRASADDKALVVQLSVKGIRVLFLSDSGFSTEQWLLENEADLRCDLLVKGQHAKDLSGTLDFIARVQPAAVICGQANFGEPPESLAAWEESVRKIGIHVFRQDRGGAVEVKINHDGFTVETFLGDQIFRSRAR